MCQHFLYKAKLIAYYARLSLSMYIFICIVRLVNGPTNYEGRVEVYHNGVWGTVCNDGWDWNDALVVCNELDLDYPIAAIPNAFYGQVVDRFGLIM